MQKKPLPTDSGMLVIPVMAKLVTDEEMSAYEKRMRDAQRRLAEFTGRYTVSSGTIVGVIDTSSAIPF